VAGMPAAPPPIPSTKAVQDREALMRALEILGHGVLCRVRLQNVSKPGEDSRPRNRFSPASIMSTGLNPSPRDFAEHRSRNIGKDRIAIMVGEEGPPPNSPPSRQLTAEIAPLVLLDRTPGTYVAA
jgi:hypothetical protein